MICVLMDFMIYNVPLLVPPYSFLMLELVQLYSMIMDSKAFSVVYLVLFLVFVNKESELILLVFHYGE